MMIYTVILYHPYAEKAFALAVSAKDQHKAVRKAKLEIEEYAEPVVVVEGDITDRILDC